MLSPAVLITISLILVGALFAIAWFGDKQGPLRAPWRPWIYTLSLGVYCTSWSFYGTINQAAAYGWPFPPTYVGTLVLFILAYGFMRRLYRLSRQHNITSIADFLAARYGKSRQVAALVTGIAVLAVLPYIALQLKAVASSFQLLSGIAHTSPAVWWQDTGFYVALLLAGFAMLFGTRRASVTEHQPGLILAVAFESLFKLLAFVGVGFFILWHWQYQPGQLEASLGQGPSDHGWPRFFSLVVLGFCAMFCLPRQFYVGFVECRGQHDLSISRWSFPLYLILMGAFTLPMAQVGIMEYGLASPYDPDTYLLRLPLDAGFPGIALLAYLGGFAAATSMVILSSVALSIMISNDLILPWWLQRDHQAPVLGLRRWTIVTVLLLAWLYYRYLGESEALGAMGGIAFAGAAQFAPAIILGVYWRGLTATSVAWGLAVGCAIWLWTLVAPIGVEAGLLPLSLMQNGPMGLSWLKPQALMGLDGLDPLSHGVLWSLLANVLTLLIAQLIRPASLEQRSTAVSYLSGAVVVPDAALDRQLLRPLLERFIGHRATQRILTESGTTASAGEVRAAERALAGVLGTASARLLIDALSQRRGMEAAEVAAIVSQAGQVVQFNRELLEVVFAHISQGVSVVDKELRLVAWNQRYQELFNYPDELLTPGRPIADLVRHNAERGWCGVGSVDDHVQKRLRWLTQSTHHRFERQRSDGIVLEMHGQPLPGGGFVTTFNDVTEYKRTQDELEQLNRALEARVAERTAALAHARDEAEQANLSKGRFLAATSHDLAQPLNAARLLVSSLQAQHNDLNSEENKAQQAAELLPQLSVVLDNAEALLVELQEMSRLERGLLSPNPQVLQLQQVFQQLRAEFLPMVQQKGLRLHVAATQMRVLSDERMLHRVLQNLLANAVRYTRSGGIVLGARRMGPDQVRIEVWDSGSGIEQDQSEYIFEEFQRGKDAAGTGLGLGLSITKRMAELMGHPLAFVSKPGLGTKFYVQVPRSYSRITPSQQEETPPAHNEQALVYCIDNDSDVLHAMVSWLNSMGYRTQGFQHDDELLAHAEQHPEPAPAAILADYHLARGSNGLALIYQLREQYFADLPAIIISADTSEALKAILSDSDVVLMSKPVKPLALRSVLNRLI